MITIGLHTFKHRSVPVNNVMFVQFALEGETLTSFITIQGLFVMFIHVPI